MATRNAGNQTELNTAFGLSVAGDIINITGWSGPMVWTARNYTAPGITIEGNGFVASNLQLNSGCSFIKLKNLTITGGSSNSAIDDVLFNFGTNNPDIAFENCTIQSSNWALITAFAGFFDLAGNSRNLYVPSGSTAPRLIVRDCTMRGRINAMTLYGVDGAIIERNDFDYISSDTLKIVGVLGGGIVRNNLFPRTSYSSVSDHRDAIVQFLSDCDGWTLHGNVFLPLVDCLTGFSGAIFGSNGNQTNMVTYQNLIACPGDAGIVLGTGAGTNHSNNTVLCYFPSGFVVSQTQVTANGGTDVRNYEGTYRSDIATVDKLTNNPAGPAGTRINSVYQTRWGGAGTNGANYKMEPIDFNPIPGGPADPATFGVNTKGAYQTIAQLLEGTWPGPVWDGPSGGGVPLVRNFTIGSIIARGGY